MFLFAFVCRVVMDEEDFSGEYVCIFFSEYLGRRSIIVKGESRAGGFGLGVRGVVGVERDVGFFVFRAVVY